MWGLALLVWCVLVGVSGSWLSGMGATVCEGVDAGLVWVPLGVALGLLVS